MRFLISLCEISNEINEVDGIIFIKCSNGHGFSLLRVGCFSERGKKKYFDHLKIWVLGLPVFVVPILIYCIKNSAIFK